MLVLADLASHSANIKGSIKKNNFEEKEAQTPLNETSEIPYDTDECNFLYEVFLVKRETF